MIRDWDDKLATDTSLANACNWGGFVVVLCGDPFQLAPVRGLCLFRYPDYPLPQRSKKAGKPTSQIDKSGIRVWHDIKSVIVLSLSMRQSADESFATMLERLRFGCPTDDDIDKLNLRRVNDENIQQILSGSNIIQAFGQRKQVKAANQQRLMQLNIVPSVSWSRHILNKKCMKVPALQKIAESNAFKREALKRVPKSREQLPESYLLFARDARVMLLTNLMQEAGLVNGAMGTVYDVLDSAALQSDDQIVYQLNHERLCCMSDKSAAELNLQPLIVLVQFDEKHYSNSMPSLLREFNQSRIVPIIAVPHHATFDMPCPPHLLPLLRECEGNSAVSNFIKGKTLKVTRWQVPLALSWAITVHKIQGLTGKDGLMVDLGTAKSFPGGAYVAVSRVKTLNDLYITGAKVVKDWFTPEAVLIKEYDRLKKLSLLTRKTVQNLDTTVPSTTEQPLLRSWPFSE